MKEHLVTVDQFIEQIGDRYGQCLFRGCHNASYSLLPSIGRAHGKQTFDVPLEKMLLDQFKLRADNSLKQGTSDLGCLVLARHYGLRTRLLDWSSNPYVALYFAVLGFDAAKCHPPCVYVVNRPLLKPFTHLEMRCPWDYSEEAVFFEPPHLDGRIVSQRAFLSLHSNPYKEFSADNLERFNLIPSVAQIDRIERILLTVGVSHSTIYPGIDGICREINDSPRGTFDQLNIERTRETEWKPVPHSWACRPWNITRARLIDERLLSEFLAFKADASIIGTEIEDGTQSLGLLLGYELDRWIKVYDPKTGHVTQVSLEDGSADELRVSKATISHYFPNQDVTFRTRRPFPDPKAQKAPTQFALYGSHYYSGPSGK